MKESARDGSRTHKTPVLSRIPIPFGYSGIRIGSSHMWELHPPLLPPNGCCTAYYTNMLASFVSLGIIYSVTDRTLFTHNAPINKLFSNMSRSLLIAPQCFAYLLNLLAQYLSYYTKPINVISRFSILGLK